MRIAICPGSFDPLTVEFQLAQMNRRLNECVETSFMMPRDIYSHLSSRMIEEIVCFGGDVRAFVPDRIGRTLADRLSD